MPAAHTLLRSFLDFNDIVFVTMGEAEHDFATKAYAQYGKGRHPAGLNMDDCFAYACAKAQNASLLFKAEDFSKTDIRAA